MTAEPAPAAPRDSASDPGPPPEIAPRLSEAEVQSLAAIIRDVSGEDIAETNHWELDTMAPLNAESTVSSSRPLSSVRELSGSGAGCTSAFTERKQMTYSRLYPLHHQHNNNPPKNTPKPKPRCPRD